MRPDRATKGAPHRSRRAAAGRSGSRTRTHSPGPSGGSEDHPRSRLKPRRLLLGSGVVGLAHATRPATRALSRALPRRRALWTDCVDDLEEAEIERQLVLRDAPVRAEPGAQQGPEPFHGVDVP